MLALLLVIHVMAIINSHAQCDTYINRSMNFGNSGFSSNPRINLSPFTKDFRGEEQQMSL